MSQQISATAALLFNTGLSRPDFMMVLATNSPQVSQFSLSAHNSKCVVPDDKTFAKKLSAHCELCLLL